MVSLVFNTFLRLMLKGEYYRNGIYYVHHIPDRGNIGDYLCSPRHYFLMENNRGRDIVILGGGVFSEYGLKRIRKSRVPFGSVVLWGVGESVRNGISPVISDLPYMAWGIRDSDMSDKHFLPCVSCMHGMLDMCLPKDEKILVFVNADPKVTSKESLRMFRRLSQNLNGFFLLNNCEEKELIGSFGRASHIVTNSYHGAYWGLLSGRRVTLMGYSSKFIDLLKSFGMSEDDMITVGRGEDVSSVVKNIDFERDYIALRDPEEMREKFRNINLDFAKGLVNAGVIKMFDFGEKSYVKSGVNFD